MPGPRQSIRFDADTTEFIRGLQDLTNQSRSFEESVASVGAGFLAGQLAAQGLQAIVAEIRREWEEVARLAAESADRLLTDEQALRQLRSLASTPSDADQLEQQANTLRTTYGMDPQTAYQTQFAIASAGNLTNDEAQGIVGRAFQTGNDPTALLNFANQGRQRFQNVSAEDQVDALVVAALQTRATQAELAGATGDSLDLIGQTGTSFEELMGLLSLQGGRDPRRTATNLRQLANIQLREGYEDLSLTDFAALAEEDSQVMRLIRGSSEAQQAFGFIQEARPNLPGAMESIRVGMRDNAAEAAAAAAGGSSTLQNAEMVRRETQAAQVAVDQLPEVNRDLLYRQQVELRDRLRAGFERREDLQAQGLQVPQLTEWERNIGQKFIDDSRFGFGYAVAAFSTDEQVLDRTQAMRFIAEQLERTNEIAERTARNTEPRLAVGTQEE